MSRASSLGSVLGGLFGRLGAVLGASWAVLERRKAERARSPKTSKKPMKINDFGFLGPSWEASWMPLGPSWRPLGPSGGHLERFGAIWSRLKALLDCLRALLDRLRALFGRSWALDPFRGGGSAGRVGPPRRDFQEVFDQALAKGGKDCAEHSVREVSHGPTRRAGAAGSVPDLSWGPPGGVSHPGSISGGPSARKRPPEA